jgi:hypothetical protein
MGRRSPSVKRKGDDRQKAENHRAEQNAKPNERGSDHKSSRECWNSETLE